jgi:molecular chaperone GrpE
MKRINPKDVTDANPEGENDMSAEPIEPEVADAGAVEADELTKLRAERDELFARLARVTAEFQNSRRRLETEFRSKLEYANADLIKVLLPVIDNFERALAVDPAKACTISG